MLKEIFVSMRPQQWYKNFVVFVGLIFSFELFNIGLFLDVFSAFIIFCMLSGGQYIINDLLDMDKDKNHPGKSKRPISSGKLNTYLAFFCSILLIVGAFYWSYTINYSFMTASFAYIVLILLYSMFLKELILVDVLVISIGFVIRAVAGAILIPNKISPWLVICTFLLALFLALAKRKHELVLLGDKAVKYRKILEKYTVRFVDQMINVVTSALVVSYSLYVLFTENLSINAKYYMMATIPFVIYGLFRYLFLIQKITFGGEPEMLFKDKGMLICMFLWTVVTFLIFYVI